MENTFLITEDNLIGSIASAMLKLKRVKRDASSVNEISSFIELVKFIDRANENDYQDLLYEKNFLVSEKVLSNLHQEFKKNDISSKIDFKELIAKLSKIVSESNLTEIDLIMNKLKDIIEILLKIKTNRQIYM
jgi:hypothetical protein